MYIRVYKKSTRTNGFVLSITHDTLRVRVCVYIGHIYKYVYVYMYVHMYTHTYVCLYINTFSHTLFSRIEHVRLASALSYCNKNYRQLGRGGRARGSTFDKNARNFGREKIPSIPIELAERTIKRAFCTCR